MFPSYLTDKLLSIRSVFQASISKQKSALQKQAMIVKTRQKELQTATLDLDVCVDPYVFWSFSFAC